MMLTQEITYRPQGGADGLPKDYNVISYVLWSCLSCNFCVLCSLVSMPMYDLFMTYQMHAVVTIGFVKDAVHHIDIQGFNVYHKNRLIKVCSFSFFQYKDVYL